MKTKLKADEAASIKASIMTLTNACIGSAKARPTAAMCMRIAFLVSVRDVLLPKRVEKDAHSVNNTPCGMPWMVQKNRISGPV